MQLHKVNMRRMSVVILLGVIVWFIIPCLVNNEILFINITPSLPRGLYLAIPGDQYREGDIVAYTPTPEVTEFCMDRGYMETKVSFIKTIGAMPGASYRIDPDLTFTIDGKKAGVVVPKDSKDRNMPFKIGLHWVPNGEFLPYTHGTRSLDGRYTGTVPLSNIKTRVIPLLTEW